MSNPLHHDQELGFGSWFGFGIRDKGWDLEIGPGLGLGLKSGRTKQRTNLSAGDIERFCSEEGPIGTERHWTGRLSPSLSLSLSRGAYCHLFVGDAFWGLLLMFGEACCWCLVRLVEDCCSLVRLVESEADRIPVMLEYLRFMKARITWWAGTLRWTLLPLTHPPSVHACTLL